MKVAYFLSFCCLFLFLNRALGLNILGAGAAMGAKLSVSGICDETIIYLLLHNLHDCAFNFGFLWLRGGGGPPGYLHLIVVEWGFPAQFYNLIEPR